MKMLSKPITFYTEDWQEKIIYLGLTLAQLSLSAFYNSRNIHSPIAEAFRRIYLFIY